MTDRDLVEKVDRMVLEALGKANMPKSTTRPERKDFLIDEKRLNVMFGVRDMLDNAEVPAGPPAYSETQSKRLDCAVGSLCDRLATLKDRLGPVTAPAGLEEDKRVGREPLPEEDCSELSRRLRRQAMELEAQCANVDDLLERLDL